MHSIRGLVRGSVLVSVSVRVLAGLLSVLAMTLGASCSKKAAATSEECSLVGTWTSCENAAKSVALSSKYVLNFSADGSLSYVTTDYDAADCGGAEVGTPSTLTAKYSLGAASTVVSGAKNLDFTDFVCSVKEDCPTAVYTLAKFDGCNTLITGKQGGDTDNGTTSELRHTALDTALPYTRLTL